MTSYKQYLVTGLVLAVVGWGGLTALIVFTLPTLGPRWLFFFLLMVALIGTALPAAAYLHRRFPSDPPADWNTILRQAIWVGVYGSILAWLQLGRVLTVALIIFLAGGFVLIEVLLRMRERAQWKPGDDAHE